MALKNLLNISNVCIINFSKIEVRKLKLNIKIIRIYLKLLKNVPKRTTFLNSYSSFKKILQRLWKLKIQLAKVNVTIRVFLNRLLLII